jgi:hypothetical protein
MGWDGKGKAREGKGIIDEGKLGIGGIGDEGRVGDTEGKGR